jgi:5-oxoprolinase (ATP-hydrolysing) subunit C
VNGLVEFVDAGAGVTIQDVGRSGHRDIGVPLAGAADPWWMACANALLGQPLTHAVLEVGLLGPTLRALHAPVRLALVGALAPRLTHADGRSTQPGSWRSLTLQPGELLAIGPCRAGIAYLALAGGIDVPLVLGSRATYARAGLGGIGGRAPLAGDRLSAGASSGPERQAAQPLAHEGGALRVLAGPQDDGFDEAAWTLFLGSEYRVSREADRMGVRLEGPVLAHRPGRGADIVSEAVVPGAVQVPGAGQPIVLGVDAQTIGGYAKIAVVIGADVPRLAHARPGDGWRFARVSRAEALAARLAQRRRFLDWQRQIGPLRADGTADEALLRSGNLISGMIDAAAGAPEQLPWE